MVIVGGYRLVYDREVAFELHVVDEELIKDIGHGMQENETLLVKIGIKVSTTQHVSLDPTIAHTMLFNVYNRGLTRVQTA